MREWLSKLKIRVKLFLAFGSILILSVTLILVVITSTRSIIRYQELNERMDQINIHSLTINGLVKDFYSQGYKTENFQKKGKSRLVQRFEQECFSQDSLLRLIPDYLSSDFVELKKALASYETDFIRLVELYKKRGFKDHGLEGELRQSIHKIEDSDYPYDRAAMLMLRRHEKDFFLRKDLRYLDRFNTQISEFENQIRNVSLRNSAGSGTLQTVGQLAIINHLENYQNKFAEIVKQEQLIGLNRDSGLIGKISKDYALIATTLEGLSLRIRQQKDYFINRSVILIFSLLAFQVIIGVLLVAFYSNVLTKAVKEIKSAISTLSQGSFPHELPVRTKDEIADTKLALNQLVNRIKEAVGFAKELGDGNLNLQYNESYKEDVLAKSIISLQDKLVEVNAQQTLMNWTNEGLARFSELLKEDFEVLETLADRVLNQLVNYTGSNQGAIYSISENHKIKRIATYAYSRKRFVEQEIDQGQGLVGQAVLEKETIYMTDVPDKYVKITSGLGHATASNLLIVPLKSKDQVTGVIELASFKLYEQHEIDFVQKISENIANLISSRINTDRTSTLLKESEEKASLLAAQEEELRQNSEEMSATHEQMKRNEEEARRVVRDLEERLLHKEKELALLKLNSENSLTNF